MVQHNSGSPLVPCTGSSTEAIAKCKVLPDRNHAQSQGTVCEESQLDQQMWSHLH